MCSPEPRSWGLPPPPTNLLLNPGFEVATNGVNPDNWTTDSRFTRSKVLVRNGSYAGRHFATDNSGYTIQQTVNNLSAGTSYSFSGWVNIRPTKDAFTFKFQVRWRNASNGTIRTDTIKTYTAATSGWNLAGASLVAPAGTTNALVLQVAISLKAKIYVDDLVFGSEETVPPFSFQLAPPASLTLQPGATGTTSTQAALVSGTSQSVSFSATGLPAGATAAFSPTSCTPTCTTTVTIHTLASTPTGTSTVTVTGTGGGTTSLTSFTLTVGAQQQSLVFAAAGDIFQNSRTSASLTALAASGADFFLAVGDLSYQGPGTEPTWCSYVKSYVGTAFPFELVSGNHEASGEGASYILNFAACLPDRLNATGIYGAQYYFDAQGLVRVILISPNIKINGISYEYAPGSAQRTWLLNAIDDARSAGIPWVVVGMHENCQTMGVKPCAIGTSLMDLLVSKKVDLILQGHDHDYQRSKQLALSAACPSVPAGSFKSACVVDDGADDAYVKGAGSLIVISGTFGAVLYAVSTSDPEAGYFAKWMGSNVNPTYGFVRYEVTADQLTADFIGSFGGNFTDSFTIHK